ncbi:Beta-monoglucosyldiacylglycerol synthase [Halotydeus destructor]|nr:Beta-monoglucosyldiacylglycerol synthase [Halotydeus destructor]
MISVLLIFFDYIQLIVEILTVYVTIFVLLNCFLNCSTFLFISIPICHVGPKVSILVPVRNEEKYIFDCITSLLNQNYNNGNCEILVMDDDSTDNTFSIISKMATKHSNLKVFKSKPLPSDWFGKVHAVDQLVKMADGDLLFHDRLGHRPWPGQPQFRSFRYESLPVPAGIRTRQINVMQLPFDGRAIGQYICIDRKALDTIGGMSSFRQVIVEDQAMAMALRKHKFRTVFLPIGQHLMHRNNEQFVDYFLRFAKLMFEVTQKNYALVLVFTLWLLYTAYLPLSVLWDLYQFGQCTHRGKIFIAIGVTVSWTVTAILHDFFHPIVILYPIFAIQYAATMAYSAIASISGKGIPWRQRYVK